MSALISVWFFSFSYSMLYTMSSLMEETRLVHCSNPLQCFHTPWLKWTLVKWTSYAFMPLYSSFLIFNLTTALPGVKVSAAQKRAKVWWLCHICTCVCVFLVFVCIYNRKTRVWSLGWEDPQRKAWQPIPIFLPGESPWTELPGRLQSMGSQRVRHNWTAKDM